MMAVFQNKKRVCLAMAIFALLFQLRPGNVGIMTTTTSWMSAQEYKYTSAGGTVAAKEYDHSGNKRSGPEATKQTNESITQASSSSCWRRCESNDRIHRIVYSYDSPAGLGDRTHILTALSNLAGYLCARLDFPSPFKALIRLHNEGQPTHPKFDWTEDFLNLTLDQDGSPMLNATLPHLSSPCVRLTTRKVNQVAEHFAIAESLVHNSSSGFVWQISMPYYKFEKQLLQVLLSYNNNIDSLPTLTYEHPGCHYVTPQIPVRVQRLANRIIASSILSNYHSGSSTMILGTLHIRRGDLKSTCDTSLERIRHYLNCSLYRPPSPSSTSKNLVNVTLLFSSDEREESYRRDLKKIVEEDLSLSGTSTTTRLVDLDALVTEQLHVLVAEVPAWKRNNNYYVFGVAGAIKAALKKNISFMLEQRRETNCHACDPLFVPMSPSNATETILD